MMKTKVAPFIWDTVYTVFR